MDGTISLKKLPVLYQSELVSTCNTCLDDGEASFGTLSKRYVKKMIWDLCVTMWYLRTTGKTVRASFKIRGNISSLTPVFPYRL